MLRIHVTGEDLARIRLADRPDPMWETVLSSLRFRDRRGPGAYGRWRELARQRLRALPPTLRALVPVGGYFPDFLTPVAAGGGWEERVELLRSTPRRRLRADMLTLEAESPQALPGWVRGLADGEREALDKVADDLDRYHRAAIAPPALWAAVQAQVDADRAVRIRHLTSGGVEGLLRGLRPVLRWEAPVLAADYPVPRELRLDGRGLLLIPSFFCWRHPVTFYDDGPRPVLVYPIQHTAAPGPAAAALGRLIGGTRARVLRCVGHGATTGELARRAGISAASASEHAGVLREAGLLVSVRRGNEVLHSLTPLGTELLPAQPTAQW
ncbi:winged helix-turn-helix domain-containing protein [Streptomyces sp. XM4011]|uniref:Helix-turn-helix domain-containing protein n=2 Tax=Streptomyces TaxID=1883 RepID=A0A1I6RFM7_9ACTN|nr:MULTISPECIES: winged helix-turn-helix domain-containing protein [Streptomyces]MCK1814691.1 winged helix-turn-helix domain-containing protein [Streptomyces sp. XM4011]SFS63527.1 Helix-turn-helix domain-containing protein [Streptomyces harbinensis]